MNTPSHSPRSNPESHTPSTWKKKITMLAAAIGLSIAGLMELANKADAPAVEPDAKPGAAGNESGQGERTDHRALEEVKKQEDMINAIRDAGGFEAYLQTLPEEDLAELFYDEKEREECGCSCCIDEGVRKYVDAQGTKHPLIKSAGGGILALEGGNHPKNPLTPEYIRHVAERNISNNVDTAEWHQKCGAARAAYGNAHDLTEAELGDVSDEEVDDFAKTFAELVAEEMKRQRVLAGNDASTVRVAAATFDDGMERPADIHNAETIYVDFTEEGFDPSFEKLPQGFGVRGELMNIDEALGNTAVAIKIAFGKHGIGELFTPENPLMVVIFVDDKNEETAILPQVEGMIAKSFPNNLGRIHVEAVKKDAVIKE